APVCADGGAEAEDPGRAAPGGGGKPDARSAAAPPAGALRRRGAPAAAGRGQAAVAGQEGGELMGALARLLVRILWPMNREDVRRAALIAVLSGLAGFAFPAIALAEAAATGNAPTMSINLGSG